MTQSFCSACGSQLSIGGGFCEQCGAPTATATNSPLGSSMQLPGQISSMTRFFASQAMLCLFTLLVFLGLVVALAPAGWRYASLQLWSGTGNNAAITDSRSVGAGNLLGRCNQIVVIFNPAATVERISALLEQLDTAIAFGPNENGAFELSVPSLKAAGVSDALNRAADAVVGASLQRLCL